MIHGQCRALLGYVFILTLVALTIGCSGGGDTNPSGPPNSTPTAKSFTGVVAIPGSAVFVQAGRTATLRGSAKTVPEKLVKNFEYAWSFTHKPDGSNAVLAGANTANPSFTADAIGSYLVKLVVTADGLSSPHTVAVVEAFEFDPSVPGNFAENMHFNHQVNSSTCLECHSDVENPPARPFKSEDHVASSNLCQACHTFTVYSFTSVAYVDHQEVFGNCSDCHNGIIAIGKSDQHVPTVVECNDCHNTTSFLELQIDGSYDHTDVVDNCYICHNGTIAIGKPAPENDPTGIHENVTDGCFRCHNTVDFADATVDHSGFDRITETCSTCHNGVQATGTDSAPNPPGHINIDDPNNSGSVFECGNCHNTIAFTPAFVDHNSPIVTGIDPTTNLPRRCDSCHNNEPPTINDPKLDPNLPIRGVTPDHMPIPTATPPMDCDACHTPGTFANGTFDHVGVTNDCASCHDGVIATGLTTNHVPIENRDCSVCHVYDAANPVFTSQVNFDHGDVNANIDSCVACHDNNYDFGANMSGGKPRGHIPALGECSVCHTTTSFVPSQFAHQNIDQGCEGCHNGKFTAAPAKVVNHIPTQQDCYVCHNVTTFNPSIFKHIGITGNCESCHDGVIATGKDGLDPPHVATTADCGLCHTTADDPGMTPPGPSFSYAVFDHSDAAIGGQRCDSCHDGTSAKGEPNDPVHNNSTEDCGLCHVPGTFTTAVFDHTGIVDNCQSCHNNTTPTATAPPQDTLHNEALLKTPDCVVCHNTDAFAGARFDHQGINNGCAACHDGNTAMGKSLNHVPTTSDCNACHNTTGFIPATFDHKGIVDNCVSCHDGLFAKGKHIDHIVTDGDCGLCHNTDAFFPATFDHTGITRGCVDCHDGTTAIGQPTPPDLKAQFHSDPPKDCYLCHTTATFVGGTFDHTGINGGCSDCHGGNTPIATGKGNGHFETTLECDACHSTAGWGPVSYNHDNAGDYPGDHNSRLNLGCTSCHRQNRATINPYPTPGPNDTYIGFCASCHARDFDPGEGDHRNGGIAENLGCGDSGCHNVNDRGW